jgi:hypothetical protein
MITSALDERLDTNVFVTLSGHCSTNTVRPCMAAHRRCAQHQWVRLTGPTLPPRLHD